MTETFDDYIGDGVYVSFDGYQIWLKAERDGFTRDTNVGEEDRA